MLSGFELYPRWVPLTLSSDWNQKEKTQQSFVVQEVVWGLKKESIEHKTV